MSEKILRALLQLFAIIGKGNAETYGTEAVRFFLKQQLSQDLVEEFLALYEHYLTLQNVGEEGEKRRKRTSVSSVKVIVLCDQINEELTQKQKTVVLIRLLEFIYSGGNAGEQEQEFVNTVASSFNIPEEEYQGIIHLISGAKDNAIDDTSNHLLISSQAAPDLKHAHFLSCEGLQGDIRVMQLLGVNLLLARYNGLAEISLSGQTISNGKTYLITPGSTIRNSKIQPIFYSDIIGAFLNDQSSSGISFTVKNLQYTFKNGKTGLYPLSFSESRGKLLGIMGGSGAGKSTLLNVLNGMNEPTSGEILINGLNLYQDKKKLEGIIGFVSQEDLLFDELTVYENLYLSSKLCFGELSDEAISKKVDALLGDLGLINAKDLKVGNALEKTISGGQRKRLNIALELIREPAVLFVDEPTSGLSSRDSENIMDLLKELSLKGKLVFVVIHQPSSEIFKMFDKLLILDQGGYPIYYGNPGEAVIYFKTITDQVNANESECRQCGNVNPEQIFNIIESKVLDEYGNLTGNRKISPKEWNTFYVQKVVPTLGAGENLSGSPASNFSKPGKFKQFRIFVQRDLLAKMRNTQYLAINILEAPLLAFILAFLTKYYKTGQAYVFSENKNLPAYIFMAVVVALFIGLTVSAEEIIKDRKNLKRESFLNLSRGSYLFSKIAILFAISAFQTLVFVLIGNYIVGIRGMYMDYWLVLFSTCCFANMLGLNISAGLNSAVTIYILIPFILIPQLLLSGIIVKFDELNPSLSGLSVVPQCGESMTSRWAFEALAVNQFKNNDFEKNIYGFEKDISNAGYKRNYWFNKMTELTNDCLDLQKKEGNSEAFTSKLELLKNELEAEPRHSGMPLFAQINQLSKTTFTTETAVALKAYLADVKKHYAPEYDNASKAKEAYLKTFESSEEGKATYKKLLEDNQNEKIASLVKNSDVITDAIVVENGRLIPTGNPVFRDGGHEHLIRAHFFAPRKAVFGNYYDTYWVNIIVIWMMSLALGITLYFDALRKLLKAFGRLGELSPRKKKR
jgi:ABC-type multidrug transport system ATPase subunit